MTWILVSLAALAVLAVAVAALGLALPRGHVVTRRAIYHQPPEAVWRAIDDHLEQPGWRPDIERVEEVSSRDGRVIWREIGRRGRTVTLERLQAESPWRLVRRIIDTELPFGGSWLVELGPVDDGTAVQITEKGEYYAPFYHLTNRLFGDPGRRVDVYLEALGRRFGEVVEVRRVG